MSSQQNKVTVEDLDKLLVELLTKEDECDAQKEVMTKLNKEYSALEYKIAAYLKDLGREEYIHAVGKFQIKTKWRVNLPQSDMDKKQFFDHLRERGIFDKFATVNSNSLNALYRQDWEAAKERGEEMTFAMPGIPAPVFETAPEFKRSKKK